MQENARNDQNELHKTIWKIADELRGSVDGWDFKQYVLGILFYRYISENLREYINSLEGEGSDYASFDDKKAERGKRAIIEEKGFFIPPSALFCNVIKNAKNDENLNVTLNEIFRNIESSSIGFESEEKVKGLFADLDVNSNKLGSSVAQRNEKLLKILNAIDSMELSAPPPYIIL